MHLDSLHGLIHDMDPRSLLSAALLQRLEAGVVDGAEFPESVAALVREGRLAAAEQRLLREFRSKPSPEHAARALGMALLWCRAGDVSRTRSWLARLPASSSVQQRLCAARLAHAVSDATLAFEWFERASGQLKDDSMSDEDRLLHGQCALAAGERARVLHGRQGSWERHLALLARAEALLEELVRSTRDLAIAQHASVARERASRLLGSKSRHQRTA